MSVTSYRILYSAINWFLMNYESRDILWVQQLSGISQQLTFGLSKLTMHSLYTFYSICRELSQTFSFLISRPTDFPFNHSHWFVQAESFFSSLTSPLYLSSPSSSLLYFYRLDYSGGAKCAPMVHRRVAFPNLYLLKNYWLSYRYISHCPEKSDIFLTFFNFQSKSSKTASEHWPSHFLQSAWRSFHHSNCSTVYAWGCRRQALLSSLSQLSGHICYISHHKQ